ncbi:MAG: hypothetical protein HZB79_10550 [Deltaproteobacteria bacterium]|nr:hypothetical protein [Deltaproteobacteria bacterium]
MRPSPSSLYLGLFFFLLSCVPSFASCDGWQKTYETLYANICYSDEKELDAFTQNIGKRSFLFKESPEKTAMLTKNRVDRIVERVAKILDMYPLDLRFNIYIYTSQKELEKVYLKMGASHIFEKTPIAFYSHKNKVIYVSLENITDGILAHEIAHTVINFYFRIPPPGNMQEILAQYVDKHLWDGWGNE